MQLAPLKELTTCASPPRALIVVPVLDTFREKNSQSWLAALKPWARFTLASVGISWTTVPTGSVPPSGERATASISSVCPSVFLKYDSPTCVHSERFRQSNVASVAMKSSASAPASTIAAASDGAPGVAPGAEEPPLQPRRPSHERTSAGVVIDSGVGKGLFIAALLLPAHSAGTRSGFCADTGYCVSRLGRSTGR